MRKRHFYDARYVVVRTESGTDVAFSIRDNQEGCWVEQGDDFCDTFTEQEAVIIKARLDRLDRLARTA